MTFEHEKKMTLSLLRDFGASKKLKVPDEIKTSFDLRLWKNRIINILLNAEDVA